MHGLRPAGHHDLELLVELRLEYIRADLAPLDDVAAAGLADQLRAWIPANLGTRFFAVLAERDGSAAAVGMLAVNEFPANPRFPHGRVGTVLNIWTRPAHRRRGLATSVMRALIRIGEEQGLDRLDLLASPDGRALYAALGFVPASQDHLPMQLALTGRPSEGPLP